MNRIWFILVASLLLLSCNKKLPKKKFCPVHKKRESGGLKKRGSA